VRGEVPKGSLRAEPVTTTYTSIPSRTVDARGSTEAVMVSRL
jgi:hypothetical protein